MLILYSADRNLFYLSCRKRFRLTVSHITAAAEANINANGIIRLVVSPVCTALSDEVVTASEHAAISARCFHFLRTYHRTSLYCAS